MKKWGFVISQNTLEVDENLPDFFDSLKLKDKEWFLSENRRMKDVYAYMVANEETVTKMERYQGSSKRPITNIAFYWLLANPTYQHQFNYFPVALKDRNEYIESSESSSEGDSEPRTQKNYCEQSDFVSFMLNLAYLKKGYALEIGLKKGFS